VVSGLVGYLMSLPSVRAEYGLDNMDYQAEWSKNMKALVMELAWEKPSDGLPLAYNGAASLLSSCDEPDTKKRDNIQGDPFSETVCTQAPLLRLDECQLTIVLAPRCLYIAEVKVVRFFLNQQCHIKITIVNFLEPFPIQYCYIGVTILSFLSLYLIEYCDIKIIIFNFDTESSWSKRGMFYEIILNLVFLAKH
jgi:hypothetical protein